MPGKITVYMYITVAVALVAVCMLYNYSSWFIIGAYCSQGVQARWFLKGHGMKYLTQYFSHKFTPPTLLEIKSKFPRYNMKCRGKPDTT